MSKKNKDFEARIEANPKVDDLWTSCWLTFQHVTGSMDDVLRNLWFAETEGWSVKRGLEMGLFYCNSNHELQELHTEIQDANLSDEDYELLKIGVINAANRLRAMDFLSAHGHILPPPKNFLEIRHTFSAYYLDNLLGWIVSEYSYNHCGSKEFVSKAKKWAKRVKAIIKQDGRKKK